MSLPTLDDFKIHLGMTGTKDDAELLDHLYAAVDVVEGVVGPLREGEVTETHYGVSSSVLILRSTPAVALTGIKARSYAGYAMSELALSDHELDGPAGLLRMTSGGWFSGDVTVTYRTGRDFLPAAIRLAILIIGGHLWETQRGTSPSALALQGSDDPTATFGAGFAIPNRATELLAPYTSSGQVA